MPYPRRLLWDILPRNTPNSQNLLLRCSPTDFTDLHRCLGCALFPRNSQNPQNLSAWVWQGCHTLLICEHLCSSVGGSSLPEVSVRSVRSVRSVGISFLPQNSQNSQNLSACVLQGCHTLLHLCASVLICGRLFSARSFCAFRAFCGNLFPPTEFTEYTEFGSVGMAGMPYPPTSVPSVGGSSQQEVLCIRCIPWELLHRLFGWCSRDCCTPWQNPQKLVCTS